MHFYLCGPLFCDEAAAKAHEFIRPEKEFEVSPVSELPHSVSCRPFVRGSFSWP